MKNIIDGALEGAIDRILVALGVSPPTLKSVNPRQSEGEKGSNEKGQGHLDDPNPRAKGKKVIQELTTKLPEIQKDGKFTDDESSEDEEVPHEIPNQEQDLHGLLKKQILDQQKQIRIMTAELEELRKAQRASERKNMDESVSQVDRTMGNSITKTALEMRFEQAHIYVDKNSPFSADIQTDPVPKNFKLIFCEYKGQGDPEEHLMKFESLCLLHQYSEGVKCRVFLTTLSGPAQQWFKQLPRSSIHSYEDLREIFLHQFVSSKKSTKNSLYLTTIKQGNNESLRDYMTRFNEAILEIPGLEAGLKTHSFIEGLILGHFFASLMKKPARTFDELLARVQKYIHMEKAMNAKMSEISNKRERKPDDRKRP